MKRSIENECSSTVSFKRTTVYTNPQIFRDILSIVTKYLGKVYDLQTWGRLRQTCCLFRDKVPNFPPLEILKQAFLTNPEMLKQTFFINTKRSALYNDVEVVARVMFVPCARRILLGWFNKQEDKLKNWKESSTTVLNSKNVPITYYSIPEEPFPLEFYMDKLKRFAAEPKMPIYPGQCYDLFDEHMYVAYPYGFITGSMYEHDHWNIFLESWKDFLSFVSDEIRLVYTSEKHDIKTNLY